MKYNRIMTHYCEQNKSRMSMCKTTISVTQLKSDKLHLRFRQDNTIVLDLKATIDTKLGIQSSAKSGHSGEYRSTNQYFGQSRSPSHYQISNMRKFMWQSESSVLYKEALKDVDSQAMIKNVL